MGELSLGGPADGDDQLHEEVRKPTPPGRPGPTALVAGTDPSFTHVIDALGYRSRRVTESLRELAEDELLQPSELPEWSRLTIACHLRFGAEALARMTRATMAGHAVAYYPEGRDRQRPRTLEPLSGESPAEVVESLALRSEQLYQLWSELDASAWGVTVREPPDTRDLGPIPLGRLPLLRLTEVEVHGTDLGLSLGDWSKLFVDTVLPMRLSWLNDRRANHRAFDADLQGSWLLVATDGPTYRVSVDGPRVESQPAGRDSRARAVIEATSRDLLALLLGRPLVVAPAIGGDVGFGRSFSQAFPGP